MATVFGQIALPVFYLSTWMGIAGDAWSYKFIWTNIWKRPTPVTAGHVSCALYKCPKFYQLLDTIFFENSDHRVSIKCPKVGHVKGTLWTFSLSLDMFYVQNFLSPRCEKEFGCFLDIISLVGHVLGIIFVHFDLWSHFWTHSGHFWEFCVQNVSIPSSCWSAAIPTL